MCPYVPYVVKKSSYVSLCTLCGLKNPLICPYVPYMVKKFMVKSRLSLTFVAKFTR